MTKPMQFVKGKQRWKKEEENLDWSMGIFIDFFAICVFMRAALAKKWVSALAVTPQSILFNRTLVARGHLNMRKPKLAATAILNQLGSSADY